jgi:hypothetical protein
MPQIGWILAYWDVVHSFIELLLTGAIVFFGWASWRTASRLAWFTGAMESHSEIMLRLEARRQKIPTVWWDPTVEAPPFHGVAHGKKCQIAQIRIFLPEHLRQHTGAQGQRRRRALDRQARAQYRLQTEKL